MNHNKTILIDGVRYHKDRPASCRQCYFWKNRKIGCTLHSRQGELLLPGRVTEEEKPL